MSEKSPGHRPRRTKAEKVARARKGKSSDPTLNGRGGRQKFVNGTVAELMQRRQKTLAAPMNGPDAVGDDTVHPIFNRFHTNFRYSDVKAVIKAIDEADVVERVEARIASRKKKKTGRPPIISYRALLVAMLLTAIDGKGCLCSEIARTLYFRLPPKAMKKLNVSPLPPHPNQTEAKRQAWRTERQVRSALKRFLTTLDPSIHPTGREVPWTELRTRDRALTPEQILDNHDALSLVCNRILRTSYSLLPVSVRKKYRGSGCIDGTPLRLNTRGRGVESLTASTDPNAGFYVRTGDHSDDGSATLRKGFFAYDINLIVGACDWLGENQYLPALPLAMHLEAPGIDPSGAARYAMADLASTFHQPRFLAGDGLYANATAKSFHTPARSLGWKLVLPILDDNLGIQANSDGLVMVEGDWYCPSIPPVLINATKEFRAKTIDRAEYLRRIGAREPYLAHLKENNKSGTQRWGCPASGSHPAVMCALKPRSEQVTFLGSIGRRRLKERIIADPDTQTNGIWPKPCRQEFVTIDLRPENEHTKDAAKFRQDLRFGTDDHTDTYNALRQSQEGFHGFAKDEAYEALGSPGKRRSRGYAAQFLFSAVLLAAAGIRKVRVFLEESKDQKDANNDLYVIRHKRFGSHATTHLPPGTKGARGDPEYEEGVA